jgi:hypothetical protein
MLDNVKTCTCCNIKFLKTEEYFFKKVIKQQNKNGIGIYHLFRSICKSCNNKKTELNRIKKRCLEMNCNVSEYEEKWKEQYSKTRTKDRSAKSQLTINQYSRFLKSGLKEVNLFKDKIEKSKIERNKRISEISKNKRKYFTDEDKRIALRGYAKNECKRLTDSYVANVVMRKPIKELSKEIIEIKRIIIQLKRELWKIEI